MENQIERFWHRAYFNLKQGYLRACIDRAYLDFCRTLNLKNYNLSEWLTIKEGMALILKKQIEIMLNQKMINQKEFDKWHHKTMLHLISKDDINELVVKQNYLTIGQAQKWINMTLKYVYLVGEQNIKNAWANFTYYHVPIDSIIQKKLIQFGVKPLEIPWSKLNEVYRYEVFQRDCRIAFPKEILIEKELELFNEIN